MDISRNMTKSTCCPAFLIVLLAVFVVSAVTTGCSGTQTVTDDHERNGEMSELEALFWVKRDSSRMNYTEADVEFMNNMIGHHAQALVMSILAPGNEAGRSVQVLASRIINAQQDEIETMQNWLRVRGRRAPQVHIDGLNLRISGGGHAHTRRGQDLDMPGMLTREQLEELARAKGRDFDRTYLRLMIEHHKGAVIMVEQLFSSDGAAVDIDVFRLASEINAEQVTEIERMKLMLETMGNP
jgi:uncharacterized protein (DUF305 family)